MEWGSAGAPVVLYTKDEGDGESNVYWSADAKAAFAAAGYSVGFGFVQRYGRSPGAWSDEDHNTARFLGVTEGLGRNPPVRINGVEHTRVGDYSDYQNPLVAQAIRNSGQVFYHPVWGYVINQDAAIAIASRFRGGTFFEKVMNSAPEILAVAFTAGAASGAFAPFTAAAETGAVAVVETAAAALDVTATAPVLESGFITDAELAAIAETAPLDVTATVGAPVIAAPPPVPPVVIPPGGTIPLPSATTLAQKALPLAIKALTGGGGNAPAKPSGGILSPSFFSADPGYLTPPPNRSKVWALGGIGFALVIALAIPGPNVRGKRK